MPKRGAFSCPANYGSKELERTKTDCIIFTANAFRLLRVVVAL